MEEIYQKLEKNNNFEIIKTIKLNNTKNSYYMLINNVNKIDITNQFFNKYKMDYSGSRNDLIKNN